MPNESPSEGAIHLVQLLLPLFDNAGKAFPAEHYTIVRDELTERFGGLTAYSRVPAQGLWHDASGPTRRDDIVVYEVMTDALDRNWWRGYRRALEKRFAQDELVIRSQEVERL